MSQNTVIGIALAIVVILGGAFFVTRKAAAPAPSPENTEQAAPSTFDAAAGIAPSNMQDGSAASPTVPQTVTVTYTDSGFSPASVTVKEGTTVRFVNNSSRQMWVASAAHPTHTAYDGTSLTAHCATGATPSFDQCAAGASGAVYSFTFTKAGTFKYHNHLQASDSGSVTVTD